MNFKWAARHEVDRAKVELAGDEEDHGLDRVDARKASGGAGLIVLHALLRRWSNRIAAPAAGKE